MKGGSRHLSGHRPRKRFGQHFLHDQAVLQRITGVCCAGSPANLLEIGPGLGALTEGLLDRLHRITAVELDRDLVSRLSKRFGPDRLDLVQKDILDCDLETLPRVLPGKPFRVVGNLPYNISTPLLFHLLDQLPQIESMVFMVQKEVAARVAAAVGQKAYGRLSVMMSLELETEVLFDIPPSAFSPPPKVDSSVIRLAPRPETLQYEREIVRKIVTAAFSHRRKTLRNTLRDMFSGEDWETLGIDPALRAEALAPQDYVRMASHWKNM